MSVVKNDEKLKKYSLNEIMAELKKLRVNSFEKENTFLTELTKKQKLIFNAFHIDIKKLQESNNYKLEIQFRFNSRLCAICATI